MKKQYSKQCKSIKQVETNNEKLFNSKLNDTEKERIRKYIDKNIGQLKERFCPHEFFKLVSEYQNKFFSDKLRKKIRKKYKNSKLDIIADKYPELYEEYFYKSLYFMFYFKSKVGRNYFNQTAENLFDVYKFGYDLNMQTRSKALKYIVTTAVGTFTTLIPVYFRETPINGPGIFKLLIPGIVFCVLVFCLGQIFEDNAYDTRLFRKLVQDEFDNN